MYVQGATVWWLKCSRPGCGSTTRQRTLGAEGDADVDEWRVANWEDLHFCPKCKAKYAWLVAHLEGIA